MLMYMERIVGGNHAKGHILKPTAWNTYVEDYAREHHIPYTEAIVDWKVSNDYRASHGSSWNRKYNKWLKEPRPHRGRMTEEEIDAMNEEEVVDALREEAGESEGESEEESEEESVGERPEEYEIEYKGKKYMVVDDANVEDMNGKYVGQWDPKTKTIEFEEEEKDIGEDKLNEMEKEEWDGKEYRVDEDEIAYNMEGEKVGKWDYVWGRMIFQKPITYKGSKYYLDTAHNRVFNKKEEMIGRWDEEKKKIYFHEPLEEDNFLEPETNLVFGDLSYDEIKEPIGTWDKKNKVIKKIVSYDDEEEYMEMEDINRLTKIAEKIDKMTDDEVERELKGVWS